MGRFACGWHRLPGSCSPGNHRPGRGPVGSIGAGEGRKVRRLEQLAAIVTTYEPEVDDLTDDELRGRTAI
ncbi:MAG: hypothetical protein ACKOI0_01285, partial [Actinomycetota bacterium]